MTYGVALARPRVLAKDLLDHINPPPWFPSGISIAPAVISGTAGIEVVSPRHVVNVELENSGVRDRRTPPVHR